MSSTQPDQGEMSNAEIREQFEATIENTRSTISTFLESNHGVFESKDLFKLADELGPLDGTAVRKAAIEMEKDECRAKVAANIPENFEKLNKLHQDIIVKLMESMLQQQSLNRADDATVSTCLAASVAEKSEGSESPSSQANGENSGKLVNTGVSSHEDSNNTDDARLDFTAKHIDHQEQDDEHVSEISGTPRYSNEVEEQPIEELEAVEVEMECLEEISEPHSTEQQCSSIQVPHTPYDEWMKTQNTEPVDHSDDTIPSNDENDNDATPEQEPIEQNASTQKGTPIKDHNSERLPQIKIQRFPLKPTIAENSSETVNDSMEGPSTSTATHESAAKAPEEIPKIIVCHCCNGGRARWNSPNLKCDSEKKKSCRIKPNTKYFFRTEDDVQKNLCEKCYNGISARQKALYQPWTNETTDMEELYRCPTCENYFHIACALFLGDDLSKFICRACGTCRPFDFQLLRKLIPTKMAREMERVLNEHVWRNGKEGDDKRNHIYIRVLHCVRQSYTTSDHAPATFSTEFEEKYGEEFQSVNRMICAFQEMDGVDTIFFTMFTQEYERHGKDIKENVAILEFLDSVPFVQPASRKGEIHRTIIASYYWYLSTIGFTRGHIFANAPVQGDDFGLPIHPSDQFYLSQGKLERFYGGALDLGVQNGLIGDFKTFEEKFGNKLADVTDLPFFPEGCWPVKMNWVEWEMARMAKVPTGDARKRKFLELLKPYLKSHKKDNFFIELQSALPPNAPIDWSQEVMMTSSTGNREEFLLFCYQIHLEFRDVQHAMFSSCVLATKWLEDQKKRMAKDEDDESTSEPKAKRSKH
ncbi:hypothetical protein GCK72_022945 [Caenorhabditis remanei]|uniref:histone acetyltransferase n=1 Tax=Caenorhabditis remanei TaxID=31234 RepID=A0A6A5FVM0_CAERE|nr:hypothetical protein GCK72_022945 [Caenorhabditis remanei]KAF1746489.1 hypothetical protein GCK72_022945 [Caenorhabditis remanei]